MKVEKENMKRLFYTILVIICTMLLVALFFMLTSDKKNDVQENEKESTNMQVVNPRKEYDSLEKLKNALDYEIRLPQETLGYEMKYYVTILDKVAEIRFYDDEENEITYRVAKDYEDDISGLYEPFSFEIQEDGIKMIGYTEKDFINGATWTKENYSYSLYTENGLNKEDVIKIIKSIN